MRRPPGTAGNNTGYQGQKSQQRKTPGGKSTHHNMFNQGPLQQYEDSNSYLNGLSGLGYDEFANKGGGPVSDM